MPWGAPFSVYYCINIEKIMKVDDLFDQHSMVASEAEKLHSRAWVYEGFPCKKSWYFEAHAGEVLGREY